jgi:uncharacterized protein (DUF2235 family)
MSKNIVICCDGTANEFAKHNTNVVKLFGTLVHDEDRQVAYYHPGIGTMEPAGALTSIARKITKLLGMAIGYGLANDIRDAYVFLMRNYQPNDKVFLFGFSRGAYTVRAVASLVKLYGLLRRDNEALVPYAIRMLRGIDRASKDDAAQQAAVKEYFELAAGFKATIAAGECHPHFAGVWDTVSSVGWIENPLKLPYIANNPDIEIGRHALALDERRAFFRSHLWRKPANSTAPVGPRDLRQVWFPGVHCDVGGGYPEKDSGLSKFALEWMIEEAVTAGLLVERDKVDEVLGKTGSGKYVPADANAMAHESLKKWWHLAELVPKRHFDAKTGATTRRCNWWRRRTVPQDPAPLVHQAAFQRRDYPHIPPNAIEVTTGGNLSRHAGG